MSIGLNANNDGTGSVQIGGSDAIQLSTGLAATFVNNVSVAGTLSVTGNASGIIKSGTAVASTSGTSIDFTGIPSTAKRITVMFNGVSTSGTSKLLIQIGSGAITTTGYAGSSSNTATTTAFSTGYICCENAATTDTRAGAVTLFNLSGNLWVETGLVVTTQGSAIPTMSSGQLTLSGVLDRVRITTINGTDTFDAGSINILWES